MQVLEANAGLLSNYEVWRVLNEAPLQKYDYDTFTEEIHHTVTNIRKAEKFRGIPYADLSQRDKKDVKRAHAAKDKMPRLRQLEQACWVRKQVLSYLGATTAVNQTQECIQTFLHRLKLFLGSEKSLSVVEVAQLIDLRPDSAVVMYRIIDDCEVRFNEAQLQELLALVQECLPPGPSNENNENGDGNGEEGGEGGGEQKEEGKVAEEEAEEEAEMAEEEQEEHAMVDTDIVQEQQGGGKDNEEEDD